MADQRWKEAAERWESDLKAAPADRNLRHRAAVAWLLAAIAASPAGPQTAPPPEATQMLDKALSHVAQEERIRNLRLHGDWRNGYYLFRDELLELAVSTWPDDRVLALAAAGAYPEERLVPYAGIGGPPYHYVRQLAGAYPDVALLQYLGGYVAAVAGEADQAEALLIRADAALPGDRRARLALLQLYDEQSRFDDARRLLAQPPGDGPGSKALQQWAELYRSQMPDGRPLQIQPAGADLLLTPEQPRQFVLAMAWAPDGLTLRTITKVWVAAADGTKIIGEHPRQTGQPEPTPPRPADPPPSAALHWGRYRLCSEAGDLVACVYYPWTDELQPRLRIVDRRSGRRGDYTSDLTLQVSYAAGPDMEPQAIAVSPDGRLIALLLEDAAHEATVLRILKLDR